MNPNPDRPLDLPIPVRALARASVTVTPAGRDGMTAELVFVDRVESDDPDDRTRPPTTLDLSAIGIDRHGAGWRHFSVEDLDLWVKVTHD